MTKEKSMTTEQYEAYRGLIKIEMKECVNGRTAILAFPDRTFSASAPDDMPKREQKPFACKKVEERARMYYIKG